MYRFLNLCFFYCPVVFRLFCFVLLNQVVDFEASKVFFWMFFFFFLGKCKIWDFWCFLEFCLAMVLVRGYLGFFSGISTLFLKTDVFVFFFFFAKFFFPGSSSGFSRSG